MRSRPKVQVYLSPPNVQPGQTLLVEAVLDSRSDTPTDAITLSLHGSERTATQSKDVLSLRASFEPKRIAKGKHSFKAHFQIPHYVPPSHRGPTYAVIYELRVHVDIPWWADLDRAFIVNVSQPPVTREPTNVVFNSRVGDVLGEELYAEATLASTIVAPGGPIVGAVSFGNTQAAKKTSWVSVELSFVGIEHGAGFTQTSHRYDATLYQGKLPEGEPIPFRVTLPPGAPPTMHGALGRMDWAFLVSVRGWSRDALLRIPIEVRPVADNVVHARLSAIGKGRRAGLWSMVAAEAGWRYDPDADVMQKQLGDMVATIVVEQRSTGGPHVVATLALGGLGIDLVVRPRSWLSSVVGDNVKTGHEPFDKTLSLEAREPEQARALIAGALAEILAMGEEVHINDTRAAIAWAGAGIDPTALRRAVKTADAAFRVLSERVIALPPPARLAKWISAWKTLGARLGGKLRPGRPEIIGGERLGRSVAVRVVWDGREGPRGVDIEVTRAPDTTETDRPPSKRATLAQKALEAIGAVTVAKDKLTLHVIGEAGDPSPLEVHVDALAELALLLEDRGEAGPYR